MAIEITEGGGYVVTGETDTRLYQVIALRTMLRTEIRTGMKFSNRGNPFQMLKQLGIVPENVKRKQKALEIVDAYLENVKTARARNVNNVNHETSVNDTTENNEIG